MIASNFLHAFVVVQPIDPCTEKVRYRVSLIYLNCFKNLNLLNNISKF